MRKLVLSSLAGLLLCLPVSGQRSTATISGTVTDSTGAIVPGAHVSATSASTDSRTETVTNAEGFYVIASLLPGIYSLQVTNAGFQTYSQGKIVLEVDRPATVNVSLKVGNQADTVTVSGEAAQVNVRSQ